MKGREGAVPASDVEGSDLARTIVTSSGRTIAVHDLSRRDAEADAPPIVLVHPLGFHAHTWVPVTERLRRGGVMLGVDLPGHGQSAHVDGQPLEWWTLAEEMAEVLDALGLQRPVAVGHSIGGALLAMVEIMSPGTFRAIWAYEPVIAPAGDMPPELRTDGPRRATRRRTRFESADHATAYFRSKPVFAVLHDEAMAAFVQHGFRACDEGVELRCRPEVQDRLGQGWTDLGAFERLGEIGCPVHVVHGHPDIYQARWATRLAPELRVGTIEAHPTLLHLGPLEDPAGIAASIDRFLADLPTNA